MSKLEELYDLAHKMATDDKVLLPERGSRVSPENPWSTGDHISWRVQRRETC